MLEDCTTSEIVALALGSNLGDRLAALRAAVEALKPFITVQKTSPVFETPPAYIADQPAYLNAALIGTTRLQPLELLKMLKQTEVDLGRTESFRFGPRLIDIDIVFFGARQLSTPELTLPHPRLAEREFVLRPLATIAGAWRHPINEMTVDAMLSALPEQTARRIEAKL